VRVDGRLKAVERPEPQGWEQFPMLHCLCPECGQGTQLAGLDPMTNMPGLLTCLVCWLGSLGMQCKAADLLLLEPGF